MSHTTYRYLFYSIGHDSLNSLLSRDKDFHDYAVEFDYPFKSVSSVQLVCSCDGLVCLWFGGKKLFCIWNPATREYKKLSESNRRYVSIVALGYDCKTNDYKLLAGGESLFEICSLGLNSWKTVQYKFYGRLGSNQSGVLVNGDFHWLAKKQDSFTVIVSMNISNEIFNEMELPRELWENDHTFNLGVLDGCLCSPVRGVDMNSLDICVMQDYGVRESWTKRYTVETITGPYWRPIWYFRTGEIVFAGSGGLFWYSPEYGRVRRPNISKSTGVLEEEIYFESLVSLNSRTYVEGRRTNSQNSDII
ncbi:F-box protein CPR1-like [Papaver somniferum]|uniref:F-box protein CPR1-like n=1 Tax=Papaver somniferum TaxID=3469 RepID=UPI000E6FA252|nr:F-box protein CPR1-like [Papaver somniferum]